MISVRNRGNFKKTERFLKKSLGKNWESLLKAYGEAGVLALQSTTPKRTGKTADSWSYELVREDGHISVVWKNSNVNQNVNVAILIQYGHGTRNGGYVEGIDYINPALKPIFQEMADKAWKEVTSL